MIVVADTGPAALSDSARARCTASWYGTLFAIGAAVRDWLSRAPAWFSVVPVEADRIQEVTDQLDLGERAAIALAGTIHADLLLIDDAAGRAEAKRVTGTLGVLRAAAERGLVNVPELVTRLKATTFYADEALLKSAFGRWLE
jgi:predicted nucleic acid-binding protein